MSAPEIKGSYVIVIYAHGSVDVYPATLERAMELFNDNKTAVADIMGPILARDPAKTMWVDKDRMAATLQAVIKGERGEVLLRSLFYGLPPKEGEDTRPTVEVNPVWRADAFAWFNSVCPDNRLSELMGYKLPDDLSELIAAMPWLKPLQERAQSSGREAVLVDGDYLKIVREYRNIEQGRWKPDALQHRVVAQILRFVHEYLVDRSDWRYLGVEQIQ